MAEKLKGVSEEAWGLDEITFSSNETDGDYQNQNIEQ